jgi:superfamily II DNA or RNA helicase
MSQTPIALPRPFASPAASVASHSRLILWPYQQEALNAIVHACQRGMRRQLLVLPTGAGKTIIAARLPEVLGDPPLLYCAHRHELLDQTFAVFHNERPDRPTAIERGSEHAGSNVLTVVASIQSLCRSSRLSAYRPQDWPVMVVDEGHRSAALSYLDVFKHFRHLPHDGVQARADGLLLGTTGTAKRTDQVGLGLVYEEVCYTKTLRDMIEDGYLAPLRGYLLRGGADLESVRTQTDDGERDFDPHALARAVNIPERNRLVVDGTRHTALAEGRPTLVFAADVAHGEALANLFCAAGVQAANIHGDMTLGARRELLDRFKNGKLEVLVNCLLLLEGINIPQISAVVMARPTQSSLLYQQALGRSTRLCPGKTDAIVLDFVDNSHKHATSLVSLPTLFGLPPRFDLKGSPAHAVIRQFEDVAVTLDSGLDAQVVEKIRSPQDIPRMFYEVDLLRIAGVPPRISRLTEFAWQRMPDGTFAITIPRPRLGDGIENGDLVLAPQDADAGGSLEIVENALGHYEVRRRCGLGSSDKLAEHPDLDTALTAADTEIRERYRDRLVLLSKRARWREQPVTGKQLRFLEILGQPIPKDRQGTIVLTKGQAQLLIDRALALKPSKPGTSPEVDAFVPADPATQKQLRYLRILRVPIPARLSKKDAQRMINKAKGARTSEPRAPQARGTH